MQGYDDSTYGSAFADVYDEWYRGISDIETTIADLSSLAGDGRVLELGVGTGRLAIPLAARLAADDSTATNLAIENRVVGIDSSEAMLAKLGENDPDRTVAAVRGDMVTGLPDGPFTLAFTAYNTLFNLRTRELQAGCFEAVVRRLAPGGHFVVEAFVPDDPPRHGDDISIRTLTTDQVVLSISRHDADQQSAEGQFVEITEAGGVHLRPWAIRYADPNELDEMAGEAGMSLEHRWESFGGAPFDADSVRHVSVYRLP